MGRRGNKSSNPLSVAAAAITRSLDPIEPSRVTVLRLLGDATRLLDECIARQAEAGAGPNDSVNSLFPHDAFVGGSQAVAAAAFTCLMRLGARGGPLRQRAMVLFRRAAAVVAKTAFLPQAAQDARSHIAGLRKDSGTSKVEFEAQVASSLLVLAEASNPRLAGVRVAEESIMFLLGPKLKHMISRRSDIAIAAAQIMASHSSSLWPEDSLVDKAVAYASASASTKLGVGGVGSALLAAACCPFLTRRGNTNACDAVVLACSRALRVAPNPAECNTWAVALARAVVCSKRMSVKLSPVCPLDERASPSEALPGFESSETVPEIESEGAPGENALYNALRNPLMFEDCLGVVAKACLPDLSAGSVWAIAAVLRMWVAATPSYASEIPGRAVKVLGSMVVCSGTLSVVKEAIMLAVWEDMKPCDAPYCLRALLALPPSMQNMSQALSLTLATEVVRTFGTDAVSSMRVGSNELSSTLDACQLALGANFSTLRQGAVSLVAAIANAAPQLRAHLLTVVLQNLRIADLQIAEDPADDSKDENLLSSVAQELSAILGNTAALAALVDAVAWQTNIHGTAFHDDNSGGSLASSAVPAALLTQCAADAEALLTQHPLANSAEPRGKAAACVRRRAGWALLASLSSAGVRDCFVNERLSRLMPLWRLELGQTHPRDNEPTPSDAAGIGQVSNYSHVAGSNIEEITAASACRSAALTALGACLRVSQRKDFRDLAMALLGATAARLSVADAGIAPLGSPAHVFSSLVGVAVSSEVHPSSREPSLGPGGSFDPSQDARRSSIFRGATRSVAKDTSFAEAESKKKVWNRTIARLCVTESECMLECVQVISPSGASAELCYHVAATMGEEAQRALGDTAGISSSGGGSTGHGLQNSSQVFGSRSGRPIGVSADGFAMVSQRKCVGGRRSYRRSELHKLDSGVCTSAGSVGSGDGAVDSWPIQSSNSSRADVSWLFSTEGTELPLAEHVLVCAAEAIAALIADNVTASGSLLESLVSSTSLSPAFSACTALALARRLSVYDFNSTGTGKALASLQVVLRKALTGSISLPDLVGDFRGSSSQKRIPVDASGFVCEKSAALCLGNPADVPGRALLSQIGRISWQDWARSFMFEGSNDDGGGLSKEYGVLGVAGAVRGLTAETYRVLAEGGGETLWLGLTQNVISSLRGSSNSSAMSQVSLVSNAAAVLGVMLDVAPEHDSDAGSSFSAPFKLGACGSAKIREVAQDAVNALCLALEANDGYVKAVAATSLSNSSPWVASNSERLFADLVCAWAEDEGGLGFDDYPTVFMEEAALGTASLRRAWYGMLEGDIDEADSPEKRPVVPFFDFDMQGPGACVGPYGMGAVAVLAACRLHWWPIEESCAESAGEIASDLIAWDPASSPTSVAAGLYCLAALWAARVDTLRPDSLEDDRGSTTSSHSSLGSFSFSNRMSLGVPSPRLHSRSSADSRIPQSPLLPPLSRAFGDDFDLDKKGTVSSRSPSDFLPCDVFDVGYIRMAELVKRLVECMCVNGRGDWWEEVRSASVASLTQLVRGVGPKVLLQRYPELPEALFTAIEGCAAGADHVVEVLARADGARRIRYWVDLCRSFFFGPDREAPDVSPRASPGCRTRAIAVASTRAVLEAAMSSVDDPGGSNRPSAIGSNGLSENSTLQDCAVDILDLACKACEAVDSGAEAAEEGIKLIQCLCASFGDESFFVEHRSQICTALCKAMQESCPYNVVRCSVSASAAILCETSFDGNLFCALLGDERPGALSTRFQYDRFSEDVGAEATIACLDRIASVVIACYECDVHGSSVRNSRLSALRQRLSPHCGMLRELFVAVVADFASMLSGGVTALSASGSSLTGPGVPRVCIEGTLRNHICTIIMGAVSLCCEANEDNARQSTQGNDTTPIWRNQEAPGALFVSGMLQGPDNMSELLVLSVCVWLMGQYIGAPQSTDVSIFCQHAGKVFHHLLGNRRISVNSRIEALLALRDLDKNSALRVICAVGDMLSKTQRSDDDGQLVKIAVSICIEELTENPSDIDVGLVFLGLSSLLPLLESDVDRRTGAETVLNVFLFVVNLPPSVSLRHFGRRSAQVSMSQSIVRALRIIDEPAKLRSVLSEMGKLMKRMHSIDLGGRLKALTAVSAALGTCFPSDAAPVIASFLCSGDEVVDSALVCEGGADFIIECLAEDGLIREYISVAVIGSLFRGVLRRMNLGHGLPRQAAARLLVDLHARAANSSVQETLLSSLLPSLARDQICGRAGAGEALRSLASSDKAAFENALSSLAKEDREAVAVATSPGAAAPV